MRADPTTPYSRLSDDMNHINPALTETLCQQMLGGLPTGRNGFPLHARFRYFDADLQRCETNHQLLYGSVRVMCLHYRSPTSSTVYVLFDCRTR